ncbi:MAG: pilus assembly protein N-terminal domain-containing protein, partial [Betaproteobacteria bacterium]|nr:pilus assembly protein N-terminal domain-containing protein [Betaproteobacteria bacterium]
MRTLTAILSAASIACLLSVPAFAQAPTPATPETRPAAPEPVPLRAELLTVNMVVGEVRTIPVRGVTRVALGNGKIVTSNVLDNEVLLLAEAPGDTSLFLWQKGGSVLRYRVRVSSVDTKEIVERLRGMLGPIAGVKIESVGDQAVISGTASKVDLPRIQLAASNFPRTLNLVREEDVTVKKMVYLKIQIMEFKKNALENIGIDWTTNIAGPAAALTFDAFSNRQFRFTPQTQDPTF